MGKNSNPNNNNKNAALINANINQNTLWIGLLLEITLEPAKIALKLHNQNKNDSNYKKMSENFEHSIAFLAACDLVFKGRVQPSGYTEPLLHKRRLEKKIKDL